MRVMRARSAALVLAGAAMLSGCRSEAESFRLRLTWLQDGALGCPAADGAEATCSSIPMSCDARVLIRIVPDEIGGVPYYSQCFRLTDPVDACALADLDILPSAIPNEMVRVQVAVWSEEQLATVPVSQLGDNGCPENLFFDGSGQPLVQVEEPFPVPALGGEIYFPVGDRREAEVRLACPRHDWLDLEACRLDKPFVHATIRDPSSWATVDPVEADKIEVRFGAPMPDGAGGWTLGAGLEFLERAPGSEGAVWSKRLEGELPDSVGCVEVFLREPGTTLAATCQDVAVVDGEVEVSGFVVRKGLVDRVLRALALDDVPAEGLVVGIVVDHLNVPVAGARVTVSPATPIAYPTDDFDHIGLNATSSTGIFLATEAPFDTGWSAMTASGVGDDGRARGGLLADHVTVVIVRMNPPLGGGEAR